MVVEPTVVVMVDPSVVMVETIGEVAMAIPVSVTVAVPLTEVTRVVSVVVVTPAVYRLVAFDFNAICLLTDGIRSGRRKGR